MIKDVVVVGAGHAGCDFYDFVKQYSHISA